MGMMLLFIGIEEVDAVIIRGVRQWYWRVCREI